MEKTIGPNFQRAAGMESAVDFEPGSRDDRKYSATIHPYDYPILINQRADFIQR